MTSKTVEQLTAWDDGTEGEDLSGPPESHGLLNDIHVNAISEGNNSTNVFCYTSYRVTYHTERSTADTKTTGIKNTYLGHLVPGQVVPHRVRKPAGKGKFPRYDLQSHISLFAWTGLVYQGLLLTKDTIAGQQAFDPCFFAEGGDEEVDKMHNRVGPNPRLMRPMGKYRHVLGENFLHGVPFRSCQDQRRILSHQEMTPTGWTNFMKGAVLPQSLAADPSPTLRLVHMLNDAENKERNAQIQKDPRHTAFRGEKVFTLWNPVHGRPENCRILDLPVGLLPAEDMLDDENAMDILRSSTITYLRGREGTSKDASLAWPSKIGFAWFDDKQFPYSAYPSTPDDHDKVFWSGPKPKLDEGEKISPDLEHVTWTGFPPTQVAYRTIYPSGGNTSDMLMHLQVGDTSILRHASGSYDFGSAGVES